MHKTSASIHQGDARLIVRCHEVSKLRNWMLKWPYSSTIWQASRQRCSLKWRGRCSDVVCWPLRRFPFASADATGLSLWRPRRFSDYMLFSTVLIYRWSNMFCICITLCWINHVWVWVWVCRGTCQILEWLKQFKPESRRYLTTATFYICTR